jgi:cardiolipin synthase
MGTEIRFLQSAFERAWLTGSQKIALRRIFKKTDRIITSDHLVRLNDSLRNRHFFYHDLLRRISQAKQRIWITSAYFVPDHRLINHLRFAAWAGVDVRILLTQKSDIFFMPWVASVFYPKLLQAGVKIYEFIPHFIHSKTMIIDDWAIVGSTNLNHRSLFHDLEVDLVLTHESTKASLQQEFLGKLSDTRVVTEETQPRRFWYQRLFVKFLLLFRQWM